MPRSFSSFFSNTKELVLTRCKESFSQVTSRTRVCLCVDPLLYNLTMRSTKLIDCRSQVFLCESSYHYSFSRMSSCLSYRVQRLERLNSIKGGSQRLTVHFICSFVLSPYKKRTICVVKRSHSVLLAHPNLHEDKQIWCPDTTVRTS